MIARCVFSLAAVLAIALQIGCRVAGSPLSADNGVTTVLIHDEVLHAHTKRIGMNMGGASFWDSSLVLNNLAYRNPGFEGMLYQSTLRCESGTANSCVDESPSAWPAGFWTGAQYEIFYGVARGRKGTVASSGRVGHKTILTFSESGYPPGKGDYVILRRHVPGKAERGWWSNLEGGAQLSTELMDLAPATRGKQALRVIAAGPGQSASIFSYFDSGGRAYIRLRGRYQVIFRAKWLAGNNAIHVAVQRGPRWFVSERVPLAPEWKQYAVTFDANESSDIVGTAQLAFEARGATFLLDDVQFVNIDPDPGCHEPHRVSNTSGSGPSGFPPRHSAALGRATWRYFRQPDRATWRPRSERFLGRLCRSRANRGRSARIS